ncbi:uncharacterized protein C2orf72 homolog isoform X1 [Pogona vitticeps]
MALREFQGLVDRAGGRERLLLVGEVREGERAAAAPRALLETFARDLFGDPPPAAGKEEEAEEAPAEGVPGGRRVHRVRGGGGGGVRAGAGWAPPGCPLLFVLVRAASLPERRRLREILRDVRGQLGAPRPAVVGVAVLPGEEEDRDGEAARAQLEALLRRVFGARRPSETLQAATYRPLGGGDGDHPRSEPGPPAAAAEEVRQAACRALRAALQLRADEVATEKQRLPFFLQCLPWVRPRQQSDGPLDTAADELREDTLQDADEGMALTNLTPNGKCEEMHGKAGS